MVEKSHTAGWLPSLYEPIRGIGEKVADWFAPRSEASTEEGSYDITMELPGVSSENIDVSVHDGSLTIKGEKRFEREEKGRTYFFSEREPEGIATWQRLPQGWSAVPVQLHYCEVGAQRGGLGTRTFAEQMTTAENADAERPAVGQQSYPAECQIRTIRT